MTFLFPVDTHRQLHIESGAFVFAFGFCPDSAAVSFDNLVGEVKAYSSAYGSYFLSGGAMPRSRQIFFVKKLSISV